MPGRMNAVKAPHRRYSTVRNVSSVSLRWRVMLLAMSMVAMVVVLMAVAVYVVVSRSVFADIDNQLHSRAQLLIESGSLAADPGKAIEGTAYSDVNAMLVSPRPLYLHGQSAGPDAATGRAREGGGAGRAAHVAAHRQQPAGAGRPSRRR